MKSPMLTNDSHALRQRWVSHPSRRGQDWYEPLPKGWLDHQAENGDRNGAGRAGFTPPVRTRYSPPKAPDVGGLSSRDRDEPNGGAHVAALVGLGIVVASLAAMWLIPSTVVILIGLTLVFSTVGVYLLVRVSVKRFQAAKKGVRKADRELLDRMMTDIDDIFRCVGSKYAR